MGKLLHKLLSILTMMSALMLSSGDLQASHAMGADITYECLGGNNYKIRVSFYRDCIGINAPNTVLVTVRSVTCGQNLSVTCNPIPGTGQQVTPLCSAAVSTCDGGVFTGIQEWIYEGVITLPMQCPDWVFSYNLCCRNAAITNIVTPASNTFYIYATLNNTITPCNNSPTFSNKPVPFACLGQQYCFNHGAYDPDGDSLVYSLITPYQNATTNVTYNAPFTATSPLTSSPPVSFNTTTGDICMTPTQLEVTVMAVLVEEYRNGVLIGSVERDLQITVMNCNNNLPSLTGINGGNNFSATVCAGQQLCFFVNSIDPDATQNVTVTWDGSIPGATFTTTPGPRPVGTFCWIPSTTDISPNPYCFTIRVRDDACPMNGEQIYSFCITVQGLTVNLGPDQLIACNDQATLTANVTGGSGNYTYQWSNGSTAPAQTVGVGTYIVTVSDGTCSATDTINVINAFNPTAAFSASGSCPNAPVQFTDLTTLPGGTITSWNWNFAGAGTSTQQNPVYTFPGSGTYNVTLIVTTSLGCTDTLTQPVVILAPPAVAFSGGPGCAGSTITFTNTTTPSTNVNYQWNFGNGQTSNSQNPSVNYTNAGTYQVSLTVTDANGCSATLTQPVVVNPVPVPAFTSNTPACQGTPVSFTNTSTPGGGTITLYQWDFGNGQTSNASNPSIIYSSGGNYNVSLTVTNSFGCTATLVQNIGINSMPVVSAGPGQSVCLGGSVTLNASGGVSYTWLPGGQTGSTITVSPATTTVYTVTGTDANGCSASSNLTITVNPLPNVTVTPNQSICAGQSATLNAGGAISYTWNPTGSSNPSIVVIPGSSTSYAVTGTDANGCSSTAFTTVTVNQNPVVNLSNAFFCVGSNATLNAGNPGSGYQWSTGQTTQTISVNSAGTYTVTVTNASGCTTTASAIVSQGGTLINSLQNATFCAGGSTVLNAGNPGNTYLWSTGATSQTITVNAGGAYSVTITDQNGCSGVLSTTVNVNPVPVANFTPNDICINQPLQFNDISTIAAGGAIVSWNWNFGDGNVSQLQDPIHSYSSWGTYNVSLIVTSDMGCTDTIIRSFNVFPLPQANFSYNFTCVGQMIQFTDMSFTQMGNITGWNWDFGSGATSTLQNPTHAFTTPGTHVVTLTITTAGGCTDTRPRNIHIYPLPDLSFTTSQNGICSGSTVSVTNTSTSNNGAINSWFWDFGNGTTSTVANPTITYTAPGTYNITLVGTTSHGCSDTLTMPFTVFTLPVADAGANQIICIGTSATLNASGGISYLWNTGSTSQSITVSPTTTTMYYVTVTDLNGCVGTDSVRVQVVTRPLTSAGPDQSICAGGSVTLNGNYGPNMTWNPGNINGQSITVSPQTTTTYVYTITNTYGCSRSDSVTVNVNPLPVVNAGPDQMICEGTTATITATGGGSYLWMPGGSTTQSIYVNPTTPTVYTVIVTTLAGCTATDTVSVGLNPVPTATLGPAFICQGSSTILNAGNPGSTYLWFPSGDTSQSIIVSDSGFYQVQITNSFGCVGVASTNVIMGGTGLVTNPTNVNLCSGQSTTLNANNPGSSYQWSTGATSQTIAVTTTGSYTVTITDQSGCSASFTSNVMVNPLPQLQFVSNPNCEGAFTLFQNQSTITTGNIMSWNWNFGNGGVSSQMHPSFTFPGAGTYPVILTAQSGMGCTASLTQNVTIYPAPQATFTANPVCEGGPVNFIDNSSVLNGVISGWNWDFGDGNTSNLQNPSHTYSSNGSFNATLIVTSANGCNDTTSVPLIVYDMPTVQLSSNSVCEGNPVSFTNGSYIGSGQITSYLWDFGDGAVSTDENPVHQYTNAGTYTVSLSATSDNNCTATATIQVTVYPRPVAAASAPAVCANSATQFINNSSVTSGSIVNTYWNFGNGSSTNAVTPSYTYSQYGTHQVLLVVTSDNGCADSLNFNVIVHPLPVPDFSLNAVCFATSALFTDLSSIPSGTINGWNWNFGDGGTSNDQNPLYTYSQSGSFQVNLTVTSDNGCTQSVSKAMNVFPVPVAAFAGNNVCEGNQSQFYSQSSIVGGGVLTCNWDFGDGNTSSNDNPSHTFQTPGVYTVTLTVTSAAGCSNTTSQTFTVYQSPAALFSSNGACDGSPVQFYDLSSSVAGPISYWNWNFGDGTNSVSAAPQHTFPGNGVYQVTLTVTSINGCMNSYTAPVNVFGLPVPLISAISNCAYDPTSFTGVTAVGDTNTYQYLWDFGDGNNSTMQSATHQYQLAGVYTVSLTMTNSNGCTATATLPLTVYPAPDAGFTATNACEASGVQITNTSTISSGSIVNYFWDFGDGNNLSGTVNPTHVYNSAGVYTITLVAISDNGCTDTVSYQVTVYPLPVPGFLYGVAEGCGPLAVPFTDSSFVATGTIVSWHWDFGNGTTSTLQNPVAIYNQSGTYSVTLTVTTDNGCSATVTQPNIITVHPGPTADFIPNPVQTTILDPVINFTNLSQGGVNYQWYFGDGSGSTQYEPTHAYSDTGTFVVTLIVENIYGCFDTITKNVVIIPVFTLYVPNAFTPNGDGTNDYFNVKGLGIEEVTLNIFNRWGENIYTSYGLEGGWDGTVQKDNTVAQQDVYVFDARVLDVFGKTHHQYGRVTLVR